MIRRFLKWLHGQMFIEMCEATSTIYSHEPCHCIHPKQTPHSVHKCSCGHEWREFISEGDLRRGTVRVGDLMAFDGGCPRYPGDKCILVGGYPAVIVEIDGMLFYHVTGMGKNND